MGHSPGIAAILTSSQGRAAVASADAGTVIRLTRQALGWNQHDLASRSGYSQPTISRIERGVSRAARDTAVLTDLAEALGVPPAALGVTSGPDQPPILDDVDRRRFLGGTVALAVTSLLPQGIATPDRIDPTATAQCWTALRRLFELEHHHGGSAVYPLAEGLARRLEDALRRGSYTPAVGRELQGVTAATMEHVGSLAYDAGWPQQARYWWLETCHLADLAGIPEARVSALAAMALQASNDPARSHEAVDLAQAARTAAREQAPPTLLSLLAAREALGHARAGDSAAAATSIRHARRWLDQGRRGDEPFWLDFWGPADLASHETRAALATGNGKSAEQAARAALATADATAFPRNYAGYTVRLGSVLTRLGHLDEAIAVTSDAVQRADAVRGSGRLVSNLKHTVELLGEHNYPPAKLFATAARRLLPALA